MSVVGIDFGNKNGVIAQASRGGVDCVLNENSKRLNEWMVSFQGKARSCGAQAASIARSNYKNTITSMKRLIGRQFDEPEVQAELKQWCHFKASKCPDGTVGVDINYDGETVVVSITHALGMMIKKMCQISADATQGMGVAEAVISVPAYFTEAQRRACLDACKIAELNCLRLMHEPTAVALSYGIFKSVKSEFDETKPKHVMFIDVGEATFSATVVSYVTGKLYVKSCKFDADLGGRDFDYAIAQSVAAKFQAKHKEDPWQYPKSAMKLLAQCEKAKKDLSPHGVKETTVFIECLVGDYDWSQKLTLDDYEGLIAPLLERMKAPVLGALEEAGVAAADLDSVELTGGTTRIAAVKRLLATTLGRDGPPPLYGLQTTMNADEACSRGCALQAAILSTRFRVKDFSIFDRVHQPVRLSWDQATNGDAAAATGGDDAEDEDGEGDGTDAGAATSITIFEAGSETPKTRRITFRRGEEFTIAAAYDVAGGAVVPEGVDPKLGTFTISGMPKGNTDRIRVLVKHSLSGTVDVVTAQLMEELPPAPADDKKAAAPASAADGKDAAPDGAAADSKADDKDGAGAADDKDGAKMDTSADEGKKDDAAAAPAEKPKKKYRKVALTVVANTVATADAKQVNAWLETEAMMTNANKVIEETNDMRNSLEGYIYGVRDKLIDSLRPFVTDDAKAALEKACEEAENWLYDGEGEDAIKSEYAKRLAALKALGNPIESRLWQSEKRPMVQAELMKTMADYSSIASSADAKYSHLNDEDRTKIRTACDLAQSWLYDMLGKQGDAAQTVDPVLTVKMIQDEQKKVVKECKPIAGKAKPAPPKPASEKKSSDSKGASDDKKSDTPPPAPDNVEGVDGDEPMTDAPAPAADAAPAAEGAEAKVDMDMD